MLTLVTGGIRSGKSRYALELARQASAAGSKCFLATAEPLDEEMKVRIARHKDERTQDFITIEEPLRISNAIEKAQKECSLILVDCLTLWVSNLLYSLENEPEQIQREIKSFIDTVRCKKTDFIFVTNEVGLGLIPDNTLGRHYIDELGNLNQSVARICDEVIFMVSGIATQIKGGTHARMDL